MMLLSHLLRRPSVSLVKSERKLFRTVLRNFSGQNQLVPVPAMGDSISEGTVVEWLKGPGDQVAVDDVVVTLETDKVSVDVRAPLTGTISAILAKIDETVNVGAPLFEILEGEISTASAEVQIPKTDASEDSSRGEKATVNVPAMGDSISEGTVVQWLKGPGDYVKTDETVVIIETDKVSVDVNAPFNGYIVESLVKLDEVVSVGSPIYTIEETNDAPPTTAPSTPVVSDAPPSASQPAKSENPSQPTSPPVSSTSSEDKNRSAFSRNETRIKISSLRQRAAERLKDTQNTAAMLTTFQTCDMGEFLSLRKDLNEMFQKKHGVELGVLSAFVKAATCALQEVPAVNAAIDEETKEIVYNDFVDINIALASANGVISPVVRNCESMSIASIEKSINLLSTQVQEQKLAVEDLSGGTFSISNAGIYGSLLSSPFLNSPQSATLGIHGIKQTPVFHNGEIVARPVMYVALTYDHRLIDGKEAVTFLKSVTDKIADPRRLLLDL